MEEVLHVPAGQRTVLGDLAHARLVVLPEQLHADHGEDEDDDGQNQGQIPQSAYGVPDDLDQRVQSRPRLRQLEDSQLKEKVESQNKQMRQKPVGQLEACFTSLNERRTERPSTLDRPNSMRLRLTMRLSKMFQPC